MMVFEDPAEPTPDGWLCVSCGASDPLFHRFPVGAAAFGAQGGSTSHSHTFVVSTTAGSNMIAMALGSEAGAPPNHTHGGTGVTSTEDHLPPFRDLKVIRPTSPTTGLPVGAIIMIDTETAPSASLALYTDEDGVFIRGGEQSATGGAATHAHTFSATLAPTTVQGLGVVTAGNGAAAPMHTHVVAGSTVAVSNEPDHALIVLARVTTADAPLPPGTIAMFDAEPGAGWAILSGAGGLLEGDFLKASSSASFDPHGASDHTHAPFTATSGAPVEPQIEYGSGVGDSAVASNAHTHSTTVTFEPASQRPRYTEVIMAKLQPTGCP